MNIDLLFLPSYSPNLNIIERLWKFVKKHALKSQYYAKFEDFKQAIITTIKSDDLEVLKELESLLTLDFQDFSKAKILTV